MAYLDGLLQSLVCEQRPCPPGWLPTRERLWRAGHGNAVVVRVPIQHHRRVVAVAVGASAVAVAAASLLMLLLLLRPGAVAVALLAVDGGGAGDIAAVARGLGAAVGVAVVWERVI